MLVINVDMNTVKLSDDASDVEGSKVSQTTAPSRSRVVGSRGIIWRGIQYSECVGCYPLEHPTTFDLFGDG